MYESHPGGDPEAENPMIYDVFLDVGNWADIGNGRVEALDYSRDGKGAATKDLAKVAKSIAAATQYKHFGQSETARATDIKKQLVNIARDISADFIWQVTETKAFADMCVKEGLNSVVAWEEDKGYNGTKPRMVKTWGVFKTSQIKSSDLVTYDSAGNIIPLTDRFRTDRTGEDAWKNNDIRYSTRAQKDAKRIKIETNKPVQASVRQSKSIQQRTMDAVHALVESKKLAEEEAKKYEIVGTMVQKLCDIINSEYVGKPDKNGMPLLPEEGKLSNNIFSNSSYSKDAEPTTECYRQATYRALYKLVTDRLGRPLTNKEQMIVNQAAIEIGVDAPCIYCYSLLDRKAKEAYKL